MSKLGPDAEIISEETMKKILSLGQTGSGPGKRRKLVDCYPKWAIDNKIDEWHESGDPRPLHEFLGWTRDEYAHWVETCELPRRTIDEG